LRSLERLKDYERRVQPERLERRLDRAGKGETQNSGVESSPCLERGDEDHWGSRGGESKVATQSENNFSRGVNSLGETRARSPGGGRGKGRLGKGGSRIQRQGRFF